ncbi:uncharacterized protein [Clytia hemisphaerica]|uniref:Aerolysin-like C-terminal domain-containing protein n=1 Tax=Clytia hemisphaerica TaxID=252671 RepID=A0A7M5WWH3_9CNID
MMNAVTLCLMLFIASGAGVDIAYRQTDDYQLIWSDKESKGDKDGSIWRVKNFQTGFCSLGDVAKGSHSRPNVKALLVTAKKAGALAHPASFTKIWTDKGSGADMSVSVWRMNPPRGYRCLGAAAMPNHHHHPDASKYCCVGHQYVTSAGVIDEYNDKGSDSDLDGAFWRVVRKGGDSSGIYGGNFLVTTNYHSSPTAAAYLLKASDLVKDVWSLPAVAVTPLNIYEQTKLDLIWSDRGSDADHDCTIWRANKRNGYYPVGDMVVRTHGRPRVGYLVQMSDPDSGDLKQPISYRQIWSDKGSGADMSVKVWRANCPSGYVALGDIATGGHYPKGGEMYCVRSKYAAYTAASNWQWVWNDKGSGSDTDVTFFEAITRGNRLLQSTRGMGSKVGHHGTPHYAPFILKKSDTTYYAEKPIREIKLRNMRYDLSKKKISGKAPQEIIPTVVNNMSSKEQKGGRTIEVQTSKTSSFEMSRSISFGLSMEVSGDVPIIGGGGFSVTTNFETSKSYTTGKSKTVTKTDSVTAEIVLPPYSRSTAYIVGNQYKADIPYIATVTKVYFDGTESTQEMSGVFKGVQIAEYEITFGEITKIPENERKPVFG